MCSGSAHNPSGMIASKIEETGRQERIAWGPAPPSAPALAFASFHIGPRRVELKQKQSRDRFDVA